MKKLPLLLLLLAGVLLLPTIGHAQNTWSFDPAFQRTPLRVTSESATGVNVLSSGKILIHTINGSLLSGANGQRIGALIRVDGNTGVIDPTWHPDPTLSAFGSLGVAEAPDGKTYYSTQVVGEVANSTDPYICRLIRLNTDGSRDSSFNSPVFAFIARFLAVQPDGKIIVCYGGTNTNGVVPANSITHTVRLNTDGTLDSTFQSPIFQLSSTGGDSSSVFGSPVIDPQTREKQSRAATPTAPWIPASYRRALRVSSQGVQWSCNQGARLFWAEPDFVPLPVGQRITPSFACSPMARSTHPSPSFQSQAVQTLV
ncbi:MAG: delta-60 repeat domain-containing protein [Chthoniobacterales bacterium]